MRSYIHGRAAVSPVGTCRSHCAALPTVGLVSGRDRSPEARAGTRDAERSNVLDPTHQPGVVAHRQHRSRDGQVQPYRPRIARCDSGDDSGATVGIIGMAARGRTSSVRLDRACRLNQADRSIRTTVCRSARHSTPPPAVLQGQHPSGQGNGQRGEVAIGGQPLATPGLRRGSCMCTPDRGRRERPVSGTRPGRQPDSRDRPSAEGTDRPPARPPCGPTPPTARSRSGSDALRVLRAGRAGRRYRPRSPL